MNKESRINNQKVGVSPLCGRGFILAVSVLIISILVTIGITGAMLAYREFSISAVSGESNYAFYGADSALECALYRDLHDDKVFWLNDKSQTNCGATTVNLTKRLYGTNNQGVLTTYTLNLPRENSNTIDCAFVEVRKLFNGDPSLSSSQLVLTDISSYGRTHCEIQGFYNVERVLRVYYTHQYEY